MTARYWVTGLPRSRTAWFSVATTTPTSICFHEPLSRLQSFAELREFWMPRLGVAMGISDSGLAPQAGRILEELKPRTLIIERPLDEAVASFRAFARKTSLHVDEAHCRRFSEISLRALGQVRRHPLVKAVDFHALDDYEVMMDAMSWLLPGREFPDLKALMTFNIQIKASEIERTANLPHTNWHLQT